MCISGQKHVNSVKTILYYGPKKSTGCPFSSIFHEKITTFMRISVKKRTFSKENTLSSPYFVRKTSILSKTLCSHVNFFKIFMKNPLLPCLYLVKKHQFYQSSTTLMAKNSKDALFSNFSRKNNCPHAHTLSKKTSILLKSKRLCSHSHIFSKIRSFSQKHDAPMTLYLNFSSKPRCCHA